MGVLNNSMWNVASGASNFYEHQIPNSLRVPATSSTSSSNGRLTQTFGTVDSKVHFTLNFWIKRNAIGGTNPVTSARPLTFFTPRSGTSATVLHEFKFCSPTAGNTAGESLMITTTNSNTIVLSTNNLFRDTSAWYNIHIQADLDNSTDSEKIKIFVNGTEASYNTDNRGSYSNLPGIVAGAWTIGDYYNYGYPAQCHFAQWAYVDGTTYAPTVFGESKNGAWIPKDLSSGITWGSAGHLLMFQDSSALGDDTSGEGNDWATANIAAHDQVIDSPTFGSSSSGNFPLWSPLIKGATNLSEGNTRMDGTTNERSAVTSWHIPIGTKFYVECLVTQANDYNIVFGLVNPYQDIATYLEDQSTVNGMIFHGYSNNDWRTNPLVNGSRQGFNALSDDSTSARVMAMTINRVDNEIKMYIDNALITNGTISISATEDYTIFASMGGGANAAIHMNINAGHDSTGAGDFSAGSATDENGFGNFQHAPPSGFLALCSANLPTPAADPAEEAQPSKFFSPYIWTGNGQNRNITIASDKKPSMTWIKNYLGDTVSWNIWQHGYSDFDGDPDSFLEPVGTALMYANQGNDGPFTGAPSATALPLTVYGQVNGNTHSYVGYVWSMNGGSNSTNTNGSVDSEVDANATVGQSLVTYTGTNNSWDNAITVGHGLDAAPDFIIAKQMTGNADEWAVFHSAVGNGGGSSAAHNSLVLNTTAALYSNQSYKGFGGVMPTSTVFTMDGNNQNRSGSKIVAMCFANKAGYSKFGSFEGNGNADGAFVYTGFSPSMIWAKSIDSTSDWFVFDNKRLGYNVDNNALSINTTAVQTTTDMVDILSNGFKFRIATDPNVAETYIYCAWADVPFNYATAR